MSYHITIVDDDALPEGHDFMFVEFPAGAHIFYRRSTLDARVLEDSWAAGRAVRQRKPLPPCQCKTSAAQVVELRTAS